MNRSQRATVLIGTIVVSLMLLFPPMMGWQRGYGFVLNRRNTYIAELDSHSYPGSGWVSWHIDQERLIFQILIVSVLSGGFVVFFGGRHK